MLEETPSVIYPLLVSKKKTQKSPNNSSDGSDTTICRASQIVESVYLEVIYWEAVGKKKNFPIHTINFSQLLFRPFWVSHLMGSGAAGKHPILTPSTLQISPGREGGEENGSQHPAYPRPVYL